MVFVYLRIQISVTFDERDSSVYWNFYMGYWIFGEGMRFETPVPSSSIIVLQEYSSDVILKKGYPSGYQ
jgi:hypothetical protein